MYLRYHNAVEAIKVIYREGDSYGKKDKSAYRKEGRKILQCLEHTLGFRKTKIRYNEAGPAVWGDHSLMGMWTDSHGLAVYIVDHCGQLQLMFRTIKAMDDYRGGHNNFMVLLDNLSIVRDKMEGLKKI